MKGIILDLCGGTGSWSKPYEDAGYKVRIIDTETTGEDIRLLEFSQDHVRGILCAPPCTMFASSGARWTRTEEEMIQALALVDACLRAVAVYKPHFWALENPVEKLKRFLGPPVLYFNPCDYGDPYTKRTLLWGRFNMPKVSPVAPTEGSKMSRLYGGPSAKTKRARSITPTGFARAFFEANP